jgi:hypothetical protein
LRKRLKLVENKEIEKPKIKDQIEKERGIKGPL